MIEAVIFDLDGVIVSTDEFHYKSWLALAKKENIEFNKTINNRLRGVSRMESLEIILEKADKDYSEEEKILLTEYKNTIYRQSLKSLSPEDILPFAEELINFLKEEGIKIAIGSSSRNTKTILKQIQMNEMFDCIVDGNDIGNSKPDPEVFLLGSKKLNVKPCNCLVIEDAVAGIEAAKAGGFIAVAINDAKNCALADYKIDSLEDVKSLI
jgi:beta-phosphoglucomutase